MKSSKQAFYDVLDLVKSSFNENRISAMKLHEFIELITYYYGHAVNKEELKRFLYTSYDSNAHIIYSERYDSLTRYLTLYFLIGFYWFYIRRILVNNRGSFFNSFYYLINVSRVRYIAVKAFFQQRRFLGIIQLICNCNYFYCL